MTPLKYIADFVNGAAFKPDEWDEVGTPIIRIQNLNGGNDFNFYAGEVDPRHHVVAGDLLFGWSGNRGTSFGPFRWSGAGLHYLNQHIFKVIPAAGVPDWLVLCSIEELMEDFLGVAADKATTMGHIKSGDLERPMALPARSRWEALDAKIRPLWDEAHAARIHASELARARDALLPLLMSGKVRVFEDLVVA